MVGRVAEITHIFLFDPISYSCLRDTDILGQLAILDLGNIDTLEIMYGYSLIYTDGSTCSDLSLGPRGTLSTHHNTRNKISNSYTLVFKLYSNTVVQPFSIAGVEWIFSQGKDLTQWLWLCQKRVKLLYTIVIRNWLKLFLDSVLVIF